MVYNHEDADKSRTLTRSRASTGSKKNVDTIVDRDTEIHQNREDNYKRRREEVIRFNHEDFTKLLQEEGINQNPEAGIHLRIENYDNLQEAEIHETIMLPESAIPQNHESFDELVLKEAETQQKHDPIPIAGNITAAILPRELPLHPHANATVMATLAFLISAVLVVLFLTGRFMAGKRRSARKTRELYQCTAEFDFEDVDLRKAITGGWHGTYRNGLAEGVEVDRDSCDLDIESNDTIISFIDQEDLTTTAPNTSLYLADKNSYFADEDSSTGVDSDDDGVFSPVRTRAF